MKKALITFVKAPVAGTVKTRLQSSLSPRKVAAIYRTFIKEILSECTRLSNVDRLLGCAPSGNHPFLKKVAARYRLTTFNQRGDNLGARIINAFSDHFDRGYQRIVLIGSDSPTIPLEYIKKAFASLARHEVVLGPCCDGGIYLIGTRKRLQPDIFHTIPWDTSSVLMKVMDRLDSKKSPFFLLPFWYDVDTVRELQFLKRHRAYLGKNLPL